MARHGNAVPPSTKRHPNNNNTGKTPLGIESRNHSEANITRAPSNEPAGMNQNFQVCLVQDSTELLGIILCLRVRPNVKLVDELLVDTFLVAGLIGVSSRVRSCGRFVNARHVHTLSSCQQQSPRLSSTGRY